MSSKTAHVLDNPVWHTLNTKQAHLALGNGLAKRYQPDIAPFVGLADESEAAYRDLDKIMVPGEIFVIGGAQVPALPPGYSLHDEITMIQMVCDQPLAEPESGVEMVTLTASDVPDILRLIDMTHPGPFFQRTIETGLYLGIRQDGQLIAMAGQRLHLPGYREISAVCTHPDHQGQGYARLLVSRIANQIWQEGDVPYLMVISHNTRAIKLYEWLHFHTRCEVRGIVLSRQTDN